jgi:tetratricopeptide (TPR) repeat protein
MINRDYLLRLIERYSRALARIIFLRTADRHEEALMLIDDLLRQMLGFGSSFLIAVPEEMLLGLVRRIDWLDVEKCLWLALLLKAEGDTYQDLQRYQESFPRYLRSLRLFLEALLPEKDLRQSPFFSEIEELLVLLAPYELAPTLLMRIMLYYEKTGRYAQAENALFEALESPEAGDDLFEQGQAFYARLLTRSAAELRAGDFSPAEIDEGLADLQRLRALRQSSQEAP